MLDLSSFYCFIRSCLEQSAKSSWKGGLEIRKINFKGFFTWMQHYKKCKLEEYHDLLKHSKHWNCISIIYISIFLSLYTFQTWMIKSYTQQAKLFVKKTLNSTTCITLSIMQLCTTSFLLLLIFGKGRGLYIQGTSDHYFRRQHTHHAIWATR